MSQFSALDTKFESIQQDINEEFDEENEELDEEDCIDYDNCNHDYIDENGICYDCAMLIDKGSIITNVTEYSDSTCNYKPTGRPDFEKDLEPLKSIPDSIKRWISEYATSARKSICRLKKRKERIFAYIILAYCKNNLIINRKEIVEELGISKNSINEAVKAAGSISQKELPQPKDLAFVVPIIIERPVNYLNEKLNMLGNPDVSKDRERIREFIIDLSNESNFILEEAAEDMCIAIINFYMNHKGMDTRKLHTYFTAKPKKIVESYEIVVETYNKMIEKYQFSRINKSKLLD